MPEHLGAGLSRHSRVRDSLLGNTNNICVQGRQPPLLAAHDYGGAEGDALRRGGWFFDTPSNDDAYSERSGILLVDWS
jgi:hypothetical protein